MKLVDEIILLIDFFFLDFLELIEVECEVMVGEIVLIVFEVFKVKFEVMIDDEFVIENIFL